MTKRIKELEKLALRAAFEHSPCLIAVVDANYKILFTNKIFIDVFGRSDNLYCYHVFKKRTQPCDGCFARSSFGEGRSNCSTEWGMTNKDQVINYRIETFPLAIKDERIDAVLMVSADVTRLTELEKGLKKAERLAMVGLTTAGLAHTIKNILSGLEGGNYLVDSGLGKRDHERISAGWQMVQEYIQQLMRLVRNLLNYAKPREPVYERVDPIELIKNIEELFRAKAGISDISLECRFGEGVEEVLMDRESIHAALSNLVSNAIDACMWDPNDDKNHRIEMAVYSTDENRVVFEITDNGMGISKKDQPQVLRAFFTTKGIRGTGLGLLLTKKAVQEHKGEIDFQSTQGVGTQFKISLPVNMEQSNDTHVESQLLDEEARSREVLSNK